MAIRPMLGKLPPEPGRPTLVLRSLVAAPLPAVPLETHNIELVPDRNMLGNDVWGDCVFVSIENNRRIAAARLGVPITRMTAEQVVTRYTSFTGARTPPGPGAVIQRALKSVRDSEWGGNHLLCFATVPIDHVHAEAVVAEFQSTIFGVVVHSADEYPATTWTGKGSVVGGHAVAGGTYISPKLAEYMKTWGLLAQFTTACFDANCDEISVLVWDFQWESLTYERQVSLVADYQTLTGRTWTGPAPLRSYEPRSANVYTAISPVRIFDTRQTAISPATSLRANTLRGVQIAGVLGLPLNAVAVTAIVRCVHPGRAGWISLSPLNGVPLVSTLDFSAGIITDGFPTVGLAPNGTLALYATQAVDVVLDVTGYYTA